MVQFLPNSQIPPAFIRTGYPPAFAMAPVADPLPPFPNPPADRFMRMPNPVLLPLQPPLAWRQPNLLPHQSLLSLWLQQNRLDKKPFTLDMITPRLGAEIGAIGLGAMGLLFKGLWGLLGGGLIGAGAGTAITSAIRRQSRKNHKPY